MKTIRVAVTGGREHQIGQEEANAFFKALLNEEQALGLDHQIILLHGNARGVDQRAAELAESWGYAVVPFEAPWGPMKKLLGEADSRWKAAGNIRNWQLLQGSDLLIAFPGGRGTADCCRQARELGVDVVYVGGEP